MLPGVSSAGLGVPESRIEFVGASSGLGFGLEREVCSFGARQTLIQILIMQLACFGKMDPPLSASVAFCVEWELRMFIFLCTFVSLGNLPKV